MWSILYEYKIYVYHISRMDHFHDTFKVFLKPCISPAPTSERIQTELIKAY